MYGFAKTYPYYGQQCEQLCIFRAQEEATDFSAWKGVLVLTAQATGFKTD